MPGAAQLVGSWAGLQTDYEDDPNPLPVGLTFRWRLLRRFNGTFHSEGRFEAVSSEVRFRPSDGGSAFTWTLEGVADLMGRPLLTFSDPLMGNQRYELGSVGQG